MEKKKKEVYEEMVSLIPDGRWDLIITTDELERDHYEIDHTRVYEEENTRRVNLGDDDFWVRYLEQFIGYDKDGYLKEDSDYWEIYKNADEETKKEILNAIDDAVIDALDY